MKTVSLILSSVLDPKVVPLAEALSAVIVLDVHLILERIHLHDFSKISTFKPGLKNQGFV